MSDFIRHLRNPAVRSAFERAAPLPKVDNYFGGCPHCGRTDGYLNIRSDHWFICDAHRTKWLIGSNLFSDWRQEAEADWRTNADKLNGYREVEPLPPDVELTAHQQYEAYFRSVVSAMVKHWCAGLRGKAFHSAVRSEFPECDKDTYDSAADVAWREMGRAP